VDARRRARRALPAGILTLVAALAAAGCIAPARTFEAFEHKAADTAEAAVSALRTAVLASRVAAEGGSFPPTVSIVLSEAEGEAIGARDAFVSIQPPDARSDRLRDELVRILDEAVGGLADLRIAARRAELDVLPELAAPLGDLADRLERFAREHER
jgi:hypothetical protein